MLYFLEEAGVSTLRGQGAHKALSYELWFMVLAVGALGDGWIPEGGDDLIVEIQAQ